MIHGKMFIWNNKKCEKNLCINLTHFNKFDIEWDNLESQVKDTQKFIKQMNGKFYFQMK
jgi:hypothetical protein